MPKVAYSEEDRERIRAALVTEALERMARQGIQHTTCLLYTSQPGEIGVDGVGGPAVGGQSALRGGAGGVGAGVPKGLHDLQLSVGESFHSYRSNLLLL